jgi:hypothetical protein
MIKNIIKMNKNLIRTFFMTGGAFQSQRFFAQQTLSIALERDLLRTILSEARLGLTLQHMGSYRELRMLQEQAKLTEDVQEKLAADASALEARVIKAKAVRHGVDEKWVREKMALHAELQAEYAKRMKELMDAVYTKVDVKGVQVIDDKLPEGMNMEVFLLANEAGLKASVELLKEKAKEVKQSIGGVIPADWKI